MAEHGSARWPDALGLLGDHNRRNALIAAAVLRALGVAGADDQDRLRIAAAGYSPLGHRLQVVAEGDGVTFVDDTLSTNVLPTLAALAAFPRRRVALIAGGHDRHIDYRPLAEGLRDRRHPTLVLTVPDNGPRIGQALHGHGAGPQTCEQPCEDQREAVARAFAWARPDGVVLLSPAAPSFGRFRDYHDRSAQFLAAALACLNNPRPPRAPDEAGRQRRPVHQDPPRDAQSRTGPRRLRRKAGLCMHTGQLDKAVADVAEAKDRWARLALAKRSTISANSNSRCCQSQSRGWPRRCARKGSVRTRSSPARNGSRAPIPS